MKNGTHLWPQCLALIKEKLQKDSWVFDTWFSPVEFESYDPQQNTLLVRVPSRYVYEFLDHYYTRYLSSAFARVASLGQEPRMQYRLMDAVPDAAQVTEYMRRQGLDLGGERIRLHYPDARRQMERLLRQFVGDRCQWLPAYDTIAAWLQDNKGRGLLCVGPSGLGKTVICTKVLPVIFNRPAIPVVLATDLHSRVDEFLKQRVVIIDDLGKEPAKRYGQPDDSFFRLCDAAEKHGNLLIITTNLSTTPCSKPAYSASILERYGNEVLDRLRAIIKSVEFEGVSMRK